ncbi:MAG: flippase [Acidobacteriota bacterium]
MQTEKFVVNYGHVLRNAVLNLVGRILPALVAVIAIPIMIRGMGTESYGVLSLALVIVTYFSLFDLGMGEATTKFIAEALGKGDIEHISDLIWTSTALIAGLGATGGLFMYFVSPFLVSHLLNISPAAQPEALSAFQIMATAVPFLLLAAGLRGALEARQRYDLVNAVTVPSTVASYLLPVVAILLKQGLDVIIMYLVISRVLTCLGFLIECLWIYPSMHDSFSIDRRLVRPLLHFGGWLAISNMSWPILLYLDRVLISSMLSVADLPFYAAPCDLITKLWVFPASWMALYPAFSAIGRSMESEIADLCALGLKHLALLLGPIVIVCVILAGPILKRWLGQTFEQHSSLAFQILALGVFLNSLGTIPDRLIKGLGHPHIVAKLHVSELPLYFCLLYLLIHYYGITGAAMAWTFRSGVEAIIMFCIADRLVPAGRTAVKKAGGIRVLVFICAFAGSAVTAFLLFHGLRLLIFGCAVLLIFGGTLWKIVLNQSERQWILAAARIR